MRGFLITTQDKLTLHFLFYRNEAPQTCSAFEKIIPFKKNFLHAKISGQEIWVDEAHNLDIIQENASVFTEPGEIVLGPLHPSRTKTSNCIGIYYGEGKGLDCCNIFGKIIAEDLLLLKTLGDNIWRNGSVELSFEPWL